MCPKGWPRNPLLLILKSELDGLVFVRRFAEKILRLVGVASSINKKQGLCEPSLGTLVLCTVADP